MLLCLQNVWQRLTDVMQYIKYLVWQYLCCSTTARAEGHCDCPGRSWLLGCCKRALALLPKISAGFYWGLCQITCIKSGGF